MQNYSKKLGRKRKSEKKCKKNTTFAAELVVKPQNEM